MAESTTSDNGVGQLKSAEEPSTTNFDTAESGDGKEQSTPEESEQCCQPSQPVSLPAPKIKHDWYQTQSDVYVNVMVKRLKPADVSVDMDTKSLGVCIQLEEERKETLEFRLAHPIVPQKSSYKVLSTKVEIKMRKSEGLQWPSLEEKEGQNTQQKLPPMAETKDNQVHKYPSSSHYTRDWDKLAAEVKKEEKDEKLEGDAALNKLFQDIYKDGNDEVRKAMNKSFVESGGTVLSTNWNEIGAKAVERKPPDGMEWKQYDK